MTKKEKFQCELLIDYALDLNNIYRDDPNKDSKMQQIIDRIETMIKNIFRNQQESQNE